MMRLVRLPVISAVLVSCRHLGLMRPFMVSLLVTEGLMRPVLLQVCPLQHRSSNILLEVVSLSSCIWLLVVVCCACHDHPRRLRLATSLFLVVLVLVLVHVEGEAVNCRLTVDVEPIAASPRQSAMEVERNADEGQTRSVVAESVPTHFDHVIIRDKQIGRRILATNATATIVATATPTSSFVRAPFWPTCAPRAKGRDRWARARSGS